MEDQRREVGKCQVIRALILFRSLEFYAKSDGELLKYFKQELMLSDIFQKDHSTMKIIGR